MAVLQFECEVGSPIEAVWGWHEEVERALVELSSPGDGVRLEKMGWEGKPYVGAELLIRARGPGGIPVRWRARYVEVEGPRAVVGGVEARFVDEQVSGPFWKWRHSHEFEAVTSGRTRCVDHVEYVPWGWPLAVPVDWWVIRPKLAEMFEYRHRVLRQVFGD